MLKATGAALLLLSVSLCIYGAPPDSAPPLLVGLGYNGGSSSDSAHKVMLDFPGSTESGQTWPLIPFPSSSSPTGAGAALIGVPIQRVVSTMSSVGIYTEESMVYTFGEEKVIGRNFSASENSTCVGPSQIIFSADSEPLPIEISKITALEQAMVVVKGKTIYGYGRPTLFGLDTTPTGCFGPRFAESTSEITVTTPLFTLESEYARIEDVMCTTKGSCALIASTNTGSTRVLTWGMQYGSATWGTLARAINGSARYDANPKEIDLSSINATCTLKEFVSVTQMCFFARCKESAKIVAFGYNERDQCGAESESDGSLRPSFVTGLNPFEITNIACGDSHCIATSTKQEPMNVIVWGSNEFGQLGECIDLGSHSLPTICSIIPEGLEKVNNNVSWIDIGARKNTSFLLDSSFRLYSLGAPVVQTSMVDSPSISSITTNATQVALNLPPYYQIRDLSPSRQMNGLMMLMVATIIPQTQSVYEACTQPEPQAEAGKTFYCIDSLWVLFSSLNASSSNLAKVPGPIVILGNYFVDPDLTLSVNVTGGIQKKRPSIWVSGCVSVTGPITIIVGEHMADSIENGDLYPIIMEGWANETCNFLNDLPSPSLPPSNPNSPSPPSSTSTPSDSSLTPPHTLINPSSISLDSTAPRPRCKTLKLSSKTDTTPNGRTSVSGKVHIQQIRGCDRRDLWWIVLLGVLGIVIVLTAVLVITFRCISYHIEKKADKEWDDRD